MISAILYVNLLDKVYNLNVYHTVNSETSVVGFEILIVVSMKMDFLWAVALCRLNETTL
jgi:hypothetical protein